MKACGDLAINDCMMLLGSRNKDVAEVESVLISVVALLKLGQTHHAEPTKTKSAKT
jgi:hypothetical protein